MKRIVLYLIFVLTSICVYADVVSTISNSIIIETHKKEYIPLKFEFYGKVGANIMSADWKAYKGGKLEEASGRSKLGVDFTIGFMSRFRPSNPSIFYWGAELSITQVGGGFDEITDSYHRRTYESCSFSGWSGIFAPTLGFKKLLSRIVSVDLHFNPGIFYKFKRGTIDYEYGTKYYDYEVVDRSLFRSSWKGGVGVWFNRVNVDLSYRYLTAFKADYLNYYNVIISIGYRF